MEVVTHTKEPFIFLPTLSTDGLEMSVINVLPAGQSLYNRFFKNGSRYAIYFKKKTLLQVVFPHEACPTLQVPLVPLPTSQCVNPVIIV